MSVHISECTRTAHRSTSHIRQKIRVENLNGRRPSAEGGREERLEQRRLTKYSTDYLFQGLRRPQARGIGDIVENY